jgi:hypothetical protein
LRAFAAIGASLFLRILRNGGLLSGVEKTTVNEAGDTGIERFSLSGRVVLVTGATRGLGLEIARGMAAAGAAVGINGRDPARAAEVAKGIPSAFPAPFDITDPSAVAAIDAIVAPAQAARLPRQQRGCARPAALAGHRGGISAA